MSHINPSKAAFTSLATPAQSAADKAKAGSAGGASFNTAFSDSLKHAVADASGQSASVSPDRGAERAAYFASVKPASAEVQAARANIFANPTFLSNGAQDNASMKQALRAIDVLADPEAQARLDQIRATMLTPYAGAPGRAMAASEIPDFDASGNYSIPGFGPAQTPLTQQQMDLYNATRSSGFAPAKPADYLAMLGIAPATPQIPTAYLPNLGLDVATVSNATLDSNKDA
ncbi:MAG: hypothetical protein V4805_08445 [Pseudomonadota bacterium]